MDMARNELKKTKDLLEMLTDSKTVRPCFTPQRVGGLRCYVGINAAFVPTRANLPPPQIRILVL